MAIGTIASGETGSSARTKINAAFAILDAGVAVLGTNIFTDLQTITQGTANKGVIASTGYSLTGSDATSMISLAGTLNSSAAVSVIDLNITDTSATTGSKWFSLRRNSTAFFDIRTSQYNDVVMVGRRTGDSDTITPYLRLGAGEINVGFGTSGIGTGELFTFTSTGTTGGFVVARTQALGFGASTVVGGGNSQPDAFFQRNAAATIQMGALDPSAAIAQTFKAHDVTTGTGASLTLSGGKGSVAGGALILGASATTGAPAAIITLKASGHINVAGIPTSASGLASGDLWSNGGVLTVA